MTWEQMFDAIKGLDDTARLEKSECTGKWYVGSRIEQGGDGFLLSHGGHEATVETAVESFWKRLTSIPLGEWLSTDHGKTGYRWNGFRWAMVHQRRAEQGGKP